MIPTLLLLGLIGGVLLALTPGRSRRRRAAIAAVPVAVAWGIAVGGMDGSFRTAVAGTLLAMANLVVGGVVGTGIGASLEPRRWRRHPTRVT